MTTLEQEIRQTFLKLFDREPMLVRSPGRINLIGEHTDYNDGFVMPAAIDKEIVFAIAPSRHQKTTIHAATYNQRIGIDLSNTGKVAKPAWANYLLGVLNKLQRDSSKIGPFDCVFGGDIPSGAGMSSSAALECGFAYALNELFDLNVPRIELVKIGQWAEHNYVGVMCGIMDQFASMMGKDKHVILLDCRSLAYTYAPLDLSDYVIILCDTKVKHALVDSEYNKRRSECETGVAIIQKKYRDVKSLRDVTHSMLEDRRSEMTGKVYDRCRYVVDEIERVQLASEDLKAGRLSEFGKKMFETHDGLSKLYEVSCKELDFLVAEASKLDYVLGARMMGGGFGGCTINIVREKHADEFVDNISKRYQQQFNIVMPCYRVKIREGTSVIESSIVPSK